MSYYITLSDLEDRITETVVRQILDDNVDGTPDANPLARVWRQAAVSTSRHAFEWSSIYSCVEWVRTISGASRDLWRSGTAQLRTTGYFPLQRRCQQGA